MSVVQITHTQKIIISLKNYFQKETKGNAPCAVCAEQISLTYHPPLCSWHLYSFYWSRVRVPREVLSAPSHSHREPDPQLWAPHHPGRVTRQALSKCHTQLYAYSLSRVSTARNWQSLNSEHLAPEPGGCTRLGKPQYTSP